MENRLCDTSPSSARARERTDCRKITFGSWRLLSTSVNASPTKNATDYANETGSPLAQRAILCLLAVPLPSQAFRIRYSAFMPRSQCRSFASPRHHRERRVLNCRSFSAAMRRYSAGEHVPWTIIRFRRAIVSHDAAITSATINESGRLRRELRFAIRATAVREGREVAIRPPGSSLCRRPAIKRFQRSESENRYLSSQTSSIRQPLKMLLTIRVSPLT